MNLMAHSLRGKGTLTIEGTRHSNNNQVLATAVVQQTFSQTQNCNGNIKDNAQQWLSDLMAGNINQEVMTSGIDIRKCQLQNVNMQIH